MRDLSLKGWVLLSKTEGLSRLVYPAKVLDLLNSIEKKIDSTSTFYGKTSLTT